MTLSLRASQSPRASSVICAGEMARHLALFGERRDQLSLDNGAAYVSAPTSELRADLRLRLLEMPFVLGRLVETLRFLIEDGADAAQV